MEDQSQVSSPSISSEIPTHSKMAKMIHWGFIAVFAFVVSKQVDEVEELEDSTLLVEEIIFASIFLILLAARYVYMHKTRPSVMPSDTPRNMLLLAKTVHFGMYASLALIALSGLVIGALYWSGIKEGAFMEAVLLFHEIAFWTSINLIALHIAGAVYHRQKGDGIWNAMMPTWRKAE